MAEITKMMIGDSVSMNENKFEDISISDQSQNSLETSKKSDSVIVDIESLSPRAIKEDNSANSNSNSRISAKLQRNLSRKLSQRERNKASSGDTNDFTNELIAGNCETDKLIIASPMVSSGTKESLRIMMERCNSMKYLKTRTSFIDPKRVLWFSATLSSMGTVVLIYLTLSITKFSGGDIE